MDNNSKSVLLIKVNDRYDAFSSDAEISDLVIKQHDEKKEHLKLLAHYPTLLSLQFLISFQDIPLATILFLTQMLLVGQRVFFFSFLKIQFMLQYIYKEKRGKYKRQPRKMPC